MTSTYIMRFFYCLICVVILHERDRASTVQNFSGLWVFLRRAKKRSGRRNPQSNEIETAPESKRETEQTAKCIVQRDVIKYNT